MKHVNIKKMSCKYKSICCSLPDNVREQPNVITGQEKFKYWPQIPVGSIRTATSVVIITPIDPFEGFLCQLINLLLNTVSDNVPGKLKPLTPIFGVEHTSQTFWCFCFSLFLFLAISLWPPLSPESCCSVRSGLLLISPRLLRKSGRCNYCPLSTCPQRPCPFIQWHTLSLDSPGDLTTDMYDWVFTPVIYRSRCTLVRAVRCQRCVSGEANFLIDRQYCGIAPTPGAWNATRLKQSNNLSEMTLDQNGVPSTPQQEIVRSYRKNLQAALVSFCFRSLRINWLQKSLSTTSLSSPWLILRCNPFFGKTIPSGAT